MMRSEFHLQRLAKELAPDSEVRSRMKQNVLKNIAVPSALSEAKILLSPSQETRFSVWERIANAIMSPSSEAFLQKVQSILTPSSTVRQYLAQRVLSKLTAAPSTPLPYSRAKWIASFAVVLILIQASPGLFIAPKTVADSKVLLIPTEGEVLVSIGGMWQPVSAEMALEPGMRVRTYNGQASILYHDAAVVRFDSNTIIAVHDTVGVGHSAPQISLLEGHVWVQGFIPSSIEGMNIAVKNGNIFVQEGSVSLQDSPDGVAVKVWDRSIRVVHNGETTPLGVGEKVLMRLSNRLLIKKITTAKFSEDWPTQNLAKDAVHRRYIAHLQHERRIAAAGILPTSTLYPAKRIAEKVDVLLTLTEESRTEKRLQYAHTRLNEAAVLLEEGDSAAEVALEDYKESVIDLIAGSGSDAIQGLVQQSLEDTVVEVAALLPGDSSYSLKKVVLEAASDLSTEVAEGQVGKALFVDGITSLHAALKAEDDVAIQALWDDMQPHLSLLEGDAQSLDAQARKEMKLLIMRFASAVRQNDAVARVLPAIVREDIIAYLPQQHFVVTLMTDEEMQASVQSMLERIYTYSMPRSRLNQVRVELLAMNGHNEQGRLVRALYYALPEQSILREKTRKEIVRLRWKTAGEQIANQKKESGTQTGTTL